MKDQGRTDFDKFLNPSLNSLSKGKYLISILLIKQDKTSKVILWVVHCQIGMSIVQGRIYPESNSL